MFFCTKTDYFQFRKENTTSGHNRVTTPTWFFSTQTSLHLTFKNAINLGKFHLAFSNPTHFATPSIPKRKISI